MNDTQHTADSAERLSALVDSELPRDAIELALKDAVQADWNCYQTIGDVLKTSGTAASVTHYGADPMFVQRLMQRLGHETMEQSAPVPNLGVVAGRHANAANDSVFRWKLLAGFASFSAVASVAWTLLGTPIAAPTQLAINASSTELVVASPQGLMVRDARLEELLSAHKQLGSTSLQVPSGFLRNAGFESNSNGR